MMFLAGKERLDTSMFLSVKDGGVYPVMDDSLAFHTKVISPASCVVAEHVYSLAWFTICKVCSGTLP